MYYKVFENHKLFHGLEQRQMLSFSNKHSFMLFDREWEGIGLMRIMMRTIYLEIPMCLLPDMYYLAYSCQLPISRKENLIL